MMPLNNRSCRWSASAPSTRQRLPPGKPCCKFRRKGKAQIAAPLFDADDAAALCRDLEAAQYATDRAFRQYDASDPENRLVTAELESRWNRALQRVREVEQKLAHHDAVSPNETTLPVEDLAALGVNLEHIWCAPGTEAKLKERIVRTVIREVVADLDNETSEIILLVHWAGSAHTEIRLPKRRRGQRNATSPDIVEAVRHVPKQERSRHRKRQSLDQGTGDSHTFIPKDSRIQTRTR